MSSETECMLIGLVFIAVLLSPYIPTVDSAISATAYRRALRSRLDDMYAQQKTEAAAVVKSVEQQVAEYEQQLSGAMAVLGIPKRSDSEHKPLQYEATKYGHVVHLVGADATIVKTVGPLSRGAPDKIMAEIAFGLTRYPEPSPDTILAAFDACKKRTT